MSIEQKTVTSNLVLHNASVTRARREAMNGHRGAIVWFTGLSGSGKSTLAHLVEEELHRRGCRTFVLDGDNIRSGLCRDLSFSPKARSENNYRVGEVAKLFMESGAIVLTALISPYRADRDQVRNLVEHGDFLEVYCDSPIEVCESRDIKGLYKKARAGEIVEFTGISSPYEVPEHPDLIVKSNETSLELSVHQVLALLEKHKVIN